MKTEMANAVNNFMVTRNLTVRAAFALGRAGDCILSESRQKDLAKVDCRASEGIYE
mgnify:CR=1 FL=1